MAADSVAARYAEALFETAQATEALHDTLEQLLLLGGLVRQHKDLREFFFNPDVDLDDKLAVLDRVLQRSWSELLRAFVRMVIAFGRAESLPGIVEAFQELVDAHERRVRVIVRSAHPLSESTVGRLRAGLARREGKTIEVEADVQPELLGGVQVIIGNRILDGSVRRQLQELRECLGSIRVH